METNSNSLRAQLAEIVLRGQSYGEFFESVSVDELEAVGMGQAKLLLTRARRRQPIDSRSIFNFIRILIAITEVSAQ